MRKITTILTSILLIFLLSGCTTLMPIKSNTPYIQDGYWYINGVNTGVKAEGVDGENGTDGKDGLNGVNGKDGIDGIDGKTPYIQDGYWYIDGINTGVKAEDDKTSNFASINNNDLSLLGGATRDSRNVTTVGGGAENKAYLKGDFHSNHFSMSAKFMVGEGSNFSFVMGKNSSYYGFWAELVNTDGKSYLNIYKDLLGNLSANPTIVNELDFTLQPNEEYMLKLTFDIITESTPKKQMVVEVFGEYNEYYTYSTTCNAYGTPFYYSNSDFCEVYDYNLSVHHYYDIRNAKAVIFGHSFVEADSLSYNRSQGFAYLLETELGKGKVLNFGIGGDSIDAMKGKIANSERFIKNCDYAFLCIGTNDRGIDCDTYISKLQECIDKIEGMGITPILFTIPHANYSMTKDMLSINDWIRSSGYHYVDMYKVFANSDGSCKETLFMNDKIHPTVEGHLYIFNRIKMDCPFLF